MLLLLFFFLLFCLAESLYFLVLESRTAAWPKVSGKLLDEGVSPDKLKTISYQTILKYSYHVSGQEFVSTCIGRGYQNTLGAKKLAQGIVARFKKEGFVDVYYNPVNPQDSVYQAGVTAKTKVMSLVLLVAVLELGGVLLFT